MTGEPRQQPAPDPALDRLKRGAFPEAAAALRRSTDRIVATWMLTVGHAIPGADPLTFDQVKDDLPNVLSWIADALETADPAATERLGRLSPDHGTVRFHQQFAPHELLEEYRILRGIVVKHVEAALGRRMTADEDLALDTGIDLTAHQAVLAFVTMQNDQLRRAVASQAKYLSFLSHDLRNNLNSVMLYLEDLRQRLGADLELTEEAADVEAMLQGIRITVDGMERMLNWERLRREKVQPATDPLRLHELVEVILREMLPHAEQKGIAIESRVPRDVVIRTDRELLALAVQNVVGNAVKYSRRGTVRIRAERRDDRWTIGVADEGPGIAPQQLERIFKAFDRGETHGQRGVGLGLAIASQAVELLGGAIGVESELGRGSKFTIILPATESAETMKLER